MTGERVKEVVVKYDNMLLAKGFALEAHHITDNSRPYEHLRWMCGEVAKFVDEGRIEKAMRWLGFLQGALWMSGHYTIDEMKEHNAPS